MSKMRPGYLFKCLSNNKLGVIQSITENTSHETYITDFEGEIFLVRDIITLPNNEVDTLKEQINNKIATLKEAMHHVNTWELVPD